jgi:hypothetical protein
LLAFALTFLTSCLALTGPIPASATTHDVEFLTANNALLPTAQPGQGNAKTQEAF